MDHHNVCIAIIGDRLHRTLACYRGQTSATFATASVFKPRPDTLELSMAAVPAEMLSVAQQDFTKDFHFTLLQVLFAP